MSNWIKSGDGTPCSCGNRLDRGFPGDVRAMPRILGNWPAFRLAMLALAMVGNPVLARDNGQYANTNPEMKAWFESLKSGKGPCCSDADGSAVSDVDWKSGGGHYRVRLEGEWIDVPDDAVITEPNRVGRTMVWPIYRDGKPVVRCFMPGSMI